MAMDAKSFCEALDAIEASKSISRETVIEALKDAMIRGYRKQLGGDDADVRVNIDPENGVLEMFHVKNVVEDVQDDFLEVSKEDAEDLVKQKVGFIDGDCIFFPASVDDLRKATAMSIKSILKQKFAEAEKDVLLETFKDKIGTMITGKVEKTDEKGVSVNIGRTSVFLHKKDMISGERFSAGDPIRLYVDKVDASTKGAHIIVSRADTGFLRCLFNEEIREIYDGTIVIKGMSREAGERSKVAVYSQNPDVDPAGACIGPNGSRIQKIVAQLGNGTSKEKIDIIAWSANPGLYIMESLKPARVVGVNYDEASKKATVIVKDDSLSLAIGRRGVNARLAVKLTEYNIDIKTETEAIENGIEYQTFEELQSKELEARAAAIAEAKLAQLQMSQKASSTDVLPGLPEGYVAPLDRHYDDEENDEVKEALELESEKYEAPKAPKVAPVAAPAVEDVAEEEAEEVAPTPVAAPAPKVEESEEKRSVRTTTTLSDLEKSLESSSKGNKKKDYKKFNRKKKDEDEAEDDKPAVTSTVDPKSYMSIYTEEELAELDKEEAANNDDSDEDIDYDEYDEYYDEEK